MKIKECWINVYELQNGKTWYGRANPRPLKGKRYWNNSKLLYRIHVKIK